MNPKIVLMTYLFTVLILGFIGATFMHENAHIEINKKYNIKSHIEWIKYFPDVATVPEGNYENCNDNCLLAHNIADGVFYPMIIFYSVWGIIKIVELSEDD